MNLIEKLIRVDKETVEKKETKKIRSARLTKLLGEETEITIQEVSGRKHNDIMQMMFRYCQHPITLQGMPDMKP